MTGLLRAQLNVEITDLRPFLIQNDVIDAMRLQSQNMPNPENFMFSLKSIPISYQKILWERTEWNRLNLGLK